MQSQIPVLVYKLGSAILFQTPVQIIQLNGDMFYTNSVPNHPLLLQSSCRASSIGKIKASLKGEVLPKTLSYISVSQCVVQNQMRQQPPVLCEKFLIQEFSRIFL